MVGVLQDQAGQHLHQDQGNQGGQEDLAILVVLRVLQLLGIQVFLVGQ